MVGNHGRRAAGVLLSLGRIVRGTRALKTESELGRLCPPPRQEPEMLRYQMSSTHCKGVPVPAASRAANGYATALASPG